MTTKSTYALKKRRQALQRKLPSLVAILRGSLIERYKRCGKSGCKCAKGRGHGPKYYLSVSFPRLRPQMDYVPQEFYQRTKKFLMNYQRAREILEGDLRDQSRTVTPTRGTLRNHDERNVFLAHRHHRSEIGRRLPRQYARDLARRPGGLPDNHGGDR